MTLVRTWRTAGWPSQWSRRLTLVKNRGCLVVFTLLALGCAKGAPRSQIGIIAPGPDAAPIEETDGQVTDAGQSDRDASGLESQPSNRSVWVLVDTEDESAGQRIGLDPPQRATNDSLEVLLSELPDASPLVRWTGPESSGDSLLMNLLDSGRVAAPVFLLAEGMTTESLRLDLTYLMNRVLEHPRVLRIDGEPALFVEQLDDEPGSLSRLEESIDSVGIITRIVTVGGTTADIPCLDMVSAASDSAVALCVYPRSVAESADRFVWRVIQTRRRADALNRPVFIDGLGRWSMDRQLNPVDGDISFSTTRMGARVEVTSYGERRLQAAQRLSEMAFNQLELGDEDGAFYLGDRDLFELNQTGDGWDVSFDYRGPQPTGLVLNSRPIFAAPGTRLFYDRGDSIAHLAVVDQFGVRFSDASDRLNCLDLGGDSGRRIEEIELVFPAGASGDGALRRIRLMSPADGPCPTQ